MCLKDEDVAAALLCRPPEYISDNLALLIQHCQPSGIATVIRSTARINLGSLSADEITAVIEASDVLSVLRILYSSKGKAGEKPKCRDTFPAHHMSTDFSWSLQSCSHGGYITRTGKHRIS